MPAPPSIPTSPPGPSFASATSSHVLPSPLIPVLGIGPAARERADWSDSTPLPGTVQELGHGFFHRRPPQ